MQKTPFIVGFIIVTLVGIWFAPAPVVCSWDFHNSLWGPANMVLQGLTPYTFHPPYLPPYWQVPAVWMPQSIGAFVWLGLLPCSFASKIWFGIEISGLLVVVWMLAGRILPSRGLFAASLLLIFLFPPLYIHFLLGQYSILFLTLVLLVVYVPGVWRIAPLLLA
ncbi:MAG: glycosyltransferase 87 family protein, partial [Leptolinea sp.]